MQSADMDVIKEVPGYKVILKAVLKNQIQQLVRNDPCHEKTVLSLGFLTRSHTNQLVHSQKRAKSLKPWI